MFEAVRKRMGKAVVPVPDKPLWSSSDTIAFTTDKSGKALPPELPQCGAPAGRASSQRGALLKGRSIRLEQGPELFGNSAYTVLIDFCKDQDEDSGYLVTFDGSFALLAAAETLSATVGTDRGERRLSSGSVRLVVKKWHRLALTFSGLKGCADLFLDGDRVSAVTDLKGARQAGNVFADLYIGSPCGGSFTGRVDNFKFLDGALAQEELPQS